MNEEGYTDVCVHPVSADIDAMADLVPSQWSSRLKIKSKLQDPISGTLVPTLPWYHAYWNEDVEDVDSTLFSSPETFDQLLAERNVEKALLMGHELRFIHALPNPEYQAALATAHNKLIRENWVNDRMKGTVLVGIDDPEAAVAEIEKYADDSEMPTVLIYSGADILLGHEYFHPIYEAAEAADMAVTIHSSGNPIHRQTALGLPTNYATYDTNLVHSHITNLVDMVFRGVFDKYPDLKVVWGGQGVTWVHQTMWRATRYHRNGAAYSPPIDKEPIEYMTENNYYTTFPVSEMPEDHLAQLYQMVGHDRILFGSGFPHWNRNTPEIIPELGSERKEMIFRGNAEAIYGL